MEGLAANDQSQSYSTGIIHTLLALPKDLSILSEW